jgi:hypothetical protein
MRSSRAAMAGSVLILFAPVSAEALTLLASRPHVTKMQAVYVDEQGWPLMAPSFAPDPLVPVWWTCRAQAHCTKGPSTRVRHAGPTSRGVTFEARATHQGQVTIRRSPVWLGQVRSVTAPRLVGDPKVGHIVGPAAGTWAGGWKGQRTEEVLFVEACPSLDATAKCVNLSASGRAYPGLGAPPTIGADLRGWYLYVVDQHIWPNQAVAGVGYSSPASVPVATLGATVARSLPVGPIT